ncbi:hypothetical protein [Mesobacillus zeae]|uniref:Uncharacterized protein n=1 Tax=Mesobacillus zeae TaxID=1917180 RepID=A0A398B7U1_9BACI|nr:hypothetical protein [Mesobacillus zeae]RID85554.1 hypothetical protein D1970_08270 [Mesobacillus zeae]
MYYNQMFQPSAPNPYLLTTPYAVPHVGPYEQFETYPGANDFSYEMDSFRTAVDVNRVMRILNQQHRNLYREIERGGMERKLSEYLFRSMVTYVDENFNRFTGNIEQKIAQASRQLSRRHPWIFDIMRIYNVSPASQNRIVDGVLRVAFRNLRPVAMPRYY